jgi:hypothetical protein
VTSQLIQVENLRTIFSNLKIKGLKSQINENRRLKMHLILLINSYQFEVIYNVLTFFPNELFFSSMVSSQMSLLWWFASFLGVFVGVLFGRLILLVGVIVGVFFGGCLLVFFL